MRFEEFIHNVESVTHIFYAWRNIPHHKIIPNYLKILFTLRILSGGGISFAFKSSLVMIVFVSF